MSKVLDFQERRKSLIENKKRNFERIVFQNFLGAYSVIDQAGTIYPITLVDMSQTGCLFQVPWTVGRDEKLPRGEELKLRMYFTKNSFIPVFVEVKYGNEFVDKDGRTHMRYGCEFVTDNESFKAMESFIQFLYLYSEYSQVDKGDHKAFFV